MKLIIQRVKQARVTAGKKVVGEIERGLFILVGFKKGDEKTQADFLASKLIKMRLMPDAEDKMNLSVIDTRSQLLVVSQFTLYANTNDGNRPSFIEAEDPAIARQLYDYFVNKLTELGALVETGSFGEYMHIEANLDGPVTIVLEK